MFPIVIFFRLIYFMIIPSPYPSCPHPISSLFSSHSYLYLLPMFIPSPSHPHIHPISTPPHPYPHLSIYFLLLYFFFHSLNFSHYYIFPVNIFYDHLIPHPCYGTLNGARSELRFRYNRVRTELQGSRLGFNVCVAPSSVKLGVLEFTEDRSWVGGVLELKR